MLLVTPNLCPGGSFPKRNHFYIVKNKKRGYLSSVDFVACVSYRASLVTIVLQGFI